MKKLNYFVRVACELEFQEDPIMCNDFGWHGSGLVSKPSGTLGEQAGAHESQTVLINNEKENKEKRRHINDIWDPGVLHQSVRRSHCKCYRLGNAARDDGLRRHFLQNCDQGGGVIVEAPIPDEDSMGNRFIRVSRFRSWWDWITIGSEPVVSWHVFYFWVLMWGGVSG
jgi:hypothetical protein